MGRGGACGAPGSVSSRLYLFTCVFIYSFSKYLLKAYPMQGRKPPSAECSTAGEVGLLLPGPAGVPGAQTCGV